MESSNFKGIRLNVERNGVKIGSIGVVAWRGFRDSPVTRIMASPKFTSGRPSMSCVFSATQGFARRAELQKPAR